MIARVPLYVTSGAPVLACTKAAGTWVGRAAPVAAAAASVATATPHNSSAAPDATATALRLLAPCPAILDANGPWTLQLLC